MGQRTEAPLPALVTVHVGSGSPSAPSLSCCGADVALVVSQWGLSPFPAVPSPGGGELLAVKWGQRLPKDTAVF